MIEVKNIVKCYDLEKPNARKEQEITIKSHWNHSNFVIIQLGNGDKITVVAKDLLVAIENATNTNRY